MSVESDQRALVAWMRQRVGKYDYTMDMHRRDEPDKYGATDCSALVRYCYKQVLGIEIGTYTGDQQRYGSLVFGTSEQTVQGALSKLQLGDLVFFDWDGVNVSIYDHVEMYIGNGQTIGHGGPGKGPVIKSFAQQWGWAHAIAARRYVTSKNTGKANSGRIKGMTVEQFWGRGVKRGGKRIPAIQELADAKTAATAARDLLAPIRRGGKYISVRQEIADAKTNTIAIQAQLEALSEQVEALAAKMEQGD